jgi:hypothetical protein
VSALQVMMKQTHGGDKAESGGSATGAAGATGGDGADGDGTAANGGFDFVELAPGEQIPADEVMYGANFHHGFCRVRVRVGLRLLYGARV